MAVTLGSTGITFPDATTQTTAATGGGSVQATFTTSAATTAGQVMVFSDSTAATVAPVTGSSATAGTSGASTVLSTSSSSGLTVGSAFDPNTAGSFVAFYYNDGGGLILRAGTLVGGSPTMGTAITVSTAGGSGNRLYCPKLMFDPVTAGKCMLIACDDTAASGLTKAWIFTVSGNTITLQSTTTLYSTNATPTAFSYYGQDVFVYAYVTTSNVAMAVACSISTYTITQGTATSIANSAEYNKRQDQNWALDMDYARPLGANKLALANINSSNFDGYCTLFTVVPATKAITAGSSTSILGSATLDGVSIAWDPINTSNLAMVGFDSDAGSNKYQRYCTTSGTSVSPTTAFGTNTSPTKDGIKAYRVAFGTTSDVSSGSTQSVMMTFWSGGLYSSCCNQYFNWYAQAFTCTSAAVVTNLGSVVQTVSDQPYQYNRTGIFMQIPNQPNKFPFVYKFDSTTVYMRTVQAAYTYSNLTSTSLIGIANASASSGASVLVNVLGGVDTHQTSLTTQSNYYVTQLGVLTTTSTSPNVSVGKAISPTSILIKGLTI